MWIWFRFKTVEPCLLTTHLRFANAFQLKPRRLRPIRSTLLLPKRYCGECGRENYQHSKTRDRRALKRSFIAFKQGAPIYMPLVHN